MAIVLIAQPLMPLHTFLVEDNHTIRDNLVATMEELVDARFVGIAAREDEARDWLSGHAHEWTLAVVDLFLAAGSGLNVIKACRQRRADQTVVVLTNYATAEIRTRCMALGATAVYDKSTQLDEFLAFCTSLDPCPPPN